MQTIFNSLKSINYWENKPKFRLGFKRNYYLNKISNSIGNQLIKVLVGQRRAGKSYIVRQIIDFLINQNKVSNKNIFYLNKELYEFKSVNNEKILSELISYYEEEIKPTGKIYIFIDEIQDISNWEQLIVSLAQHPIKDYEIFITGSNSTLLSGELASLISGRYIVFEVFPFSYVEYLNNFSLENKKENLIKFIKTSGLPEIYNLNNEETRKHYFASLKDTILLKDIMYRYKIRDYVLLEDIFLFLLHNVGNLTSISSILKYFKSKNRKVDYSTVSSYLSYMEEAFIIKSSNRLHSKTKELLSGEKKYYVNDLGFRNYLFPRLKNDIGSILENVVFNQLKISGYDVHTGNQNDLEIDFIAEKDDKIMYVQVSYLLHSEETINREFKVLEMIKDAFPKYVITMDDFLISNPKGIIHKNIWDFMSNL